MNTLQNAITFSSGESRFISVQVSIKQIKYTNKKSRDRFQLKFKVKDNGVGMSEDKLQSLFDPLSKED